MSAEELPEDVAPEELLDALHELDAARAVEERARKAQNAKLDLAGPGEALTPAAMVFAKRVQALTDPDLPRTNVEDALEDARALLERTDGSEHPLRAVLAEAVEETTTEEAKASPATQAPHHWLRSGRDLLEQPDPGPIDWLVEELLVEQALGVIQGHYKAGKSWLALELGAAIVTGRDALGRSRSRGRVR